MRKDQIDAISKTLPKIRIGDAPVRSAHPDFSKMNIDIDPDDFAPNRTAKSAKHIEELLEESANESRRTFRVAVIALVVSSIAAAAAVIGVIIQLV